jgi:hypothetical protein
VAWISHVLLLLYGDDPVPMCPVVPGCCMSNADIDAMFFYCADVPPPYIATWRGWHVPWAIIASRAVDYCTC